MDKITKDTFHNRFHIEFLPTEMLVGLKLVNCEVMCEDGNYRPVQGIELGLIFLKISFVHMKWESH